MQDKEGGEEMDYEKEIRQLKESNMYIEKQVHLITKTLRIFAWSAFGNAITVLLLAINLLIIVRQW